MTKFYASLIAAISGLFIIAVFTTLSIHIVVDSKLPRCQEDEIIQGSGDFVNGRWDEYNCAHEDTL